MKVGCRKANFVPILREGNDPNAQTDIAIIINSDDTATLTITTIGENETIVCQKWTTTLSDIGLSGSPIPRPPLIRHPSVLHSDDCVVQPQIIVKMYCEKGCSIAKTLNEVEPKQVVPFKFLYPHDNGYTQTIRECEAVKVANGKARFVPILREGDDPNAQTDIAIIINSDNTATLTITTTYENETIYYERRTTLQRMGFHMAKRKRTIE